MVGVWQRPDTIVSSTEYRPDIDCLRAFAVSSVIAFHYDISPFRSGYVGVDYVMAGKGMNDPHPGLEIVIHIQAGAGDLNLIESLSTGQGKTSQLFRGIST